MLSTPLNVYDLYNAKNAITHPNLQFHSYILLWGFEYIALVIGHTYLYQVFQNLDTKRKLEGELLNRTVAR